MKYVYMASLYYDRKSGHTRWGVVNNETQEWFFPKSYGQDKCRKLATRMNKQAERVKIEKAMKKKACS